MNYFYLAHHGIQGQKWGVRNGPPYPLGSYGHLGVRWWYGGGHSVFWKNENGRIRIYDGQSGEEYKTNGRLFESIQMDQITYIRLDNLEPTDNVLKIVE